MSAMSNLEIEIRTIRARKGSEAARQHYSNKLGRPVDNDEWHFIKAEIEA